MILFNWYYWFSGLHGEVRGTVLAMLNLRAVSRLVRPHSFNFHIALVVSSCAGLLLAFMVKLVSAGLTVHCPGGFQPQCCLEACQASLSGRWLAFMISWPSPVMVKSVKAGLTVAFNCLAVLNLSSLEAYRATLSGRCLAFMASFWPLSGLHGLPLAFIGHNGSFNGGI